MPKAYRRELRKIEADFLEELNLYEKVLKATRFLSLNQHGINTTGRGVRAVKIFTRQTLTGISLKKILPKPSPKQPGENDFWDIGSIASLSRNLLEGYLSLNYFGLEQISGSEAELRFFILQLHKNTEWFSIRKREMDKKEYDQFEEGIKEQKGRVKNHPYMKLLSSNHRKRAKQGNEMYKTKYDFEKEFFVCENLTKYYRLLSNFVHPTPLSTERTDDEKGRGVGSDNDIGYCLSGMMLGRKFLAASTVGVADIFPTELGEKYHKVIDPIRPLLYKGFERK
ncbi:MAG: hypothetical protein WBB45_11740 [Cyclobacteriaceae bacterium]